MFKSPIFILNDLRGYLMMSGLLFFFWVGRGGANLTICSRNVDRSACKLQELGVTLPTCTLEIDVSPNRGIDFAR